MTHSRIPLPEALMRLEQSISPRDYPPTGKNWFAFVKGQHPVLLSAPHACRHMRDGAEKMAEEYTSALARLVAQETGSHAIFTTHKTNEDPNWHPGGDYKNRVRQCIEKYDIRLVVDIHGMTNRYQMGVALGTMDGRSTKGVDVVSAFEQRGFTATDAEVIGPPLSLVSGQPLPRGEGAERYWRRVVIDHPRFTGGVKNHTVTRFVSELQVAAVQVEIASVNRIVHCPASDDWPFEYRGKAEGINAVVAALTDLVRSV